MTEKTIEILKKYESYLLCAYKADFVRGITSTELEELIKAGEDLGIVYKANHCPKCTLNFVKQLAVPYFEYKRKEEENGKEKRVSKKDTNRSKKVSDS